MQSHSYDPDTGERLRRGYIPEPNTGCWIWIMTRDRLGYGRVSLNKRTVLAHRAIYELEVGPIPDGLELDHLCRNAWCVNPAHLEPVTHRVNVRRGFAGHHMKNRKTHCPSGHPYIEGSFRVTKEGWRECRKCRANSCKKWRAKRDAI